MLAEGSASVSRRVRVCLVYDCLFPHTVGGAERWYRNVAERLAAAGHEVTYLTLRQWDRSEDPGVPGVRVEIAGPRLALYGSGGERKVLPPLVFGAGVFWHLARHGGRYDVVHTASFPYFSLLAAGLLRRLRKYRLVVDWHEFWSAGYWRHYLGRVGGRVGWAVQCLCLRVPQRAFCFARLTEGRLKAEGIRGPVTVLEGEYAGSLTGLPPSPADPLIVYAGRHTPEKRVPAIVAAVKAARRRRPDLRARILGDGPQRPDVLAAILRCGLESAIEAPGFVSADEVERTFAGALCLLSTSEREGYGMIVVEAASRGVPSILVAGPDNAATELVQEGVNGFVAASVDPEHIADAIDRVHAAGPALRVSTAAWFAENAQRLSIDASLERVLEAYARTEG